MRFGAFEWFILVPMLFILGVKVPELGFRRPLRALLLFIGVLALTDPSVRLLSEALDVWLLVDRSASAKNTLGNHLAEWEGLLRNGKRASDRLRVIDYADVAIDRGQGDATYFETDRDDTRTGLALHHAAAQFDAGRNNRVLLLTDGFSTEPLKDAGELLRRSGAALDYRLPPEGMGQDLQIDEVRVPQNVQPGEKFLIEILVSGQPEGAAPVKLYRDNTLIFDGSIDVAAGLGQIKLADSLESRAGAYRYRARIDPPTDRLPGNNTVEAWTEVRGPKSVLVISTYPADPLPTLLRDRGIEARLVNDPSSLHVGMLSGATAVILNNVSASHIPRDFLKALPFYVSEQGGGLLMTGGENSFGSGGYFESDIDKLLPVSMELKEEERRVATAMVLVLDRSGSMAAGVEGNSGSMRKMDLADEGAARTVSLLGSRDRLSIYAVDSEPHAVVPLTTVGGNQAEMMGKARSIESNGGGIFVYTGLMAAWKELQQEKTLQRHIILFADAADAEEPGEYQTLLAEITKTKSTVSVIGLGHSTDSDAEFLTDVAKRGNGRIFFVSNAMDLPAVFAQETVSVARSTFVKEPVSVRGTEAWKQVSSFQPHWLDSIDGYNLNYLRPQAHAVLLGKDEYVTPMVAVWQRGLGRAAAVSFPIAGDFSARARAWTDYGDFLHTMIHWLRGPELPVGVQVRNRIAGRTLLTDFYYDNTWADRVSTSIPKLLLANEAGGEPQDVRWQRVGPGHFQASAQLSGAAPVEGVVQVGEYSLPFGPVTLGRGAEWNFDRRRVLELEEVARESGGGERVNLADIWNVPRTASEWRLRTSLLILFLLLFLLEALLSRLNKTLLVSIPQLGEFTADLKARWRSRKPEAANPETDTEPAVAEQQAAEKSAVEAKQAERWRSIFEKAKRGGL